MTDLIERLQSERSPLSIEAAREIERLREAKRRALAIADERVKENTELRMRLSAAGRTTQPGDR